MSSQSPIIREDRGGIAVLVLDCPGRSMNVVDETVLARLADLIDEIEGDPDIHGVVFASGKAGSFGAGADIRWLPELAARDDADAFLASTHDLMLRIANSRRPYVAAIEGSAFGGALEIALSMHGIVARVGTTLGLPETNLGLIPGGAGTQLLLRWVSTADALDLLLTGRGLDAESASRLGLVTSVVGTSADLVGAAVELAQKIVAGASRPAIRDSPEEGLAAVAARESDTGAAAAAALNAVRAGIAEGWAAGCAVERSGFLELLRSAESRARIHLFLAEAAIKRRSRATSGEVHTIGVVGGGQMGSGIAANAATRGLTAVVRDVTEEALGRSRDYLTRVLERQGVTSDERERIPADWSGTTGWLGFGKADAVIEAVFELPELKRDTLAQIESVVADSALIATNTSAIPVGSLATALERPGRFLGMHFFSPVERMPLVELIPHAGTDLETIGTALLVARRLGKVPVVVADRPGFFTSRVYARWLIEGIRLLLEGVEVEVIDRVARAAGFATGPLQAHDEATLDLVAKASIAQVAERVMSSRIDVDAVRSALETLIAAGMHGRRPGAGLYSYQDGRRTGADPRIHDLLGVVPATVAEADIRDRLLLAFATECFLCWDDGTLRDPADGDVASVLGIGFPRAAGGPFHWADEQGLAWVQERCAELGEAFPTGVRLGELAAAGGRFADEPRRTE